MYLKSIDACESRCNVVKKCQRPKVLSEPIMRDLHSEEYSLTHFIIFQRCGWYFRFVAFISHIASDSFMIACDLDYKVWFLGSFSNLALGIIWSSDLDISIPKPFLCILDSQNFSSQAVIGATYRLGISQKHQIWETSRTAKICSTISK